MTITGPRNLGEVSNADLGGLFDAYLRPFAGGAAHFYLGGAAGIDTAALAWLAEHTNVGLTVVVPCALVDQPAIAVETVNRWRKRVDEVVELQALELVASFGFRVDPICTSSLAGRTELAEGPAAPRRSPAPLIDHRGRKGSPT